MAIPCNSFKRNCNTQRGQIAQFEIQKIQPDLEFEEVENLYGENRGGIGSSGIK